MNGSVISPIKKLQSIHTLQPNGHKKMITSPFLRLQTLRPYISISLPHLNTLGQYYHLFHKFVNHYLFKFGLFCSIMDISAESLSLIHTHENII